MADKKATEQGLRLAEFYERFEKFDGGHFKGKAPSGTKFGFGNTTEVNIKYLSERVRKIREHFDTKAQQDAELKKQGVTEELLDFITEFDDILDTFNPSNFSARDLKSFLDTEDRTDPEFDGLEALGFDQSDADLIARKLIEDKRIFSKEDAAHVRPRSVQNFAIQYLMDHPGVDTDMLHGDPVYRKALADYVQKTILDNNIAIDLVGSQQGQAQYQLELQGEPPFIGSYDQWKEETTRGWQEQAAVLDKKYGGISWWDAAVEIQLNRDSVSRTSPYDDYTVSDVPVIEVDPETGDVVNIVPPDQWKAFVSDMLQKYDSVAVNYLLDNAEKIQLQYSQDRKDEKFLGNFIEWGVATQPEVFEGLYDALDYRILDNDPIIDKLIFEAYGALPEEHGSFIRGVIKRHMANELDNHPEFNRKEDVWNAVNQSTKNHWIDLALNGMIANYENVDEVLAFLESSHTTLVDQFLKGETGNVLPPDGTTSYTMMGELFTEFVDNLNATLPEEIPRLGIKSAEESMALAQFVEENFASFATGLDSQMYRLYMTDMTTRVRSILGRNSFNPDRITETNLEQAMKLINGNDDWNPNIILRDAILDEVSAIDDEDMRNHIMKDLLSGASVAQAYKAYDLEDAATPGGWERTIKTKFADFATADVAGFDIDPALAAIINPAVEGLHDNLRDVALASATETFNREMALGGGATAEDIIAQFGDEIIKNIELDIMRPFDDTTKLFIEQSGGLQQFFTDFPTFTDLTLAEVNGAINDVVFADPEKELRGANASVIAALTELQNDPNLKGKLEDILAPTEEARAEIAAKEAEQDAKAAVLEAEADASKERIAEIDRINEKNRLERERGQGLAALDEQSRNKIREFFGESLTAQQANLVMQDFGGDLTSQLSALTLGQNEWGQASDFSNLDAQGNLLPEVGEFTLEGDLFDFFGGSVIDQGRRFQEGAEDSDNRLTQEQDERLQEQLDAARARSSESADARSRSQMASQQGFAALGLNDQRTLGFLRESQVSRQIFRTSRGRQRTKAQSRQTLVPTSTRLQ